MATTFGSRYNEQRNTETLKRRFGPKPFLPTDVPLTPPSGGDAGLVLEEAFRPMSTRPAYAVPIVKPPSHLTQASSNVNPSVVSSSSPSTGAGVDPKAVRLANDAAVKNNTTPASTEPYRRIGLPSNENTGTGNIMVETGTGRVEAGMGPDGKPFQRQIGQPSVAPKYTDAERASINQSASDQRMAFDAENPTPQMIAEKNAAERNANVGLLRQKNSDALAIAKRDVDMARPEEKAAAMQAYAQLQNQVMAQEGQMVGLTASGGTASEKMGSDERTAQYGLQAASQMKTADNANRLEIARQTGADRIAAEGVKGATTGEAKLNSDRIAALQTEFLNAKEAGDKVRMKQYQDLIDAELARGDGADRGEANYVRVKSKTDPAYLRLPVGAKYIGPDGLIGTKQK